MIIFIIF